MLCLRQSAPEELANLSPLAVGQAGQDGPEHREQQLPELGGPRIHDPREGQEQDRQDGCRHAARWGFCVHGCARSQQPPSAEISAQGQQHHFKASECACWRRLVGIYWSVLKRSQCRPPECRVQVNLLHQELSSLVAQGARQVAASGLQPSKPM